MDQIAAVPVVFLFLFFSFSAQAQDPCENGVSAGLYPCENVDLYAFMGTNDLTGNFGIEYNDIWGWTDPLDGQEYVILGQTDGTAFIRITDPVNPEYLGFLPTHTVSSLWRDIKVYNNYAFIVAESSGHGMQVFDLTRLRTAVPPQTFTEDAHYGNFGNAHNIVINEDVGLAYAVGSNTFAGGLHIVDISNPLNPVIAGDFAADGYTHDAQVVTYNGPDATYVGRQIAFNANENTLTIVDVNDPTDTQQLSSLGYTNVAYAHQGWLTDDHRYFLLGDELDEANFGNNTRTIIYDVQDLNNPVVIGEYTSSTAAIDHNLYIDGNLIYQSNYRAGLRILDGSDVANGNLNEVAFFDVYPSSDAAQFNGSWSNYPYFESGIVAVSHIEEGLFLLKPQFVNAQAQQAQNCAADPLVIDVTVVAGFEGPVNLSVNGLPAGATGTFSANNVGPGTYTLTITGLPQQTQVLDLEIVGVGASQTYRDNISVEVIDCANEVLGCTDPAASNYDPAATIDDGSCTYPCVDVTLEITTDCWGEEVSWQLTDDLGNVIDQMAGNTLGDQVTTTWTYCLPVGCYNWTIADSFGDGMSGSQYGSCGVDGDYNVTDVNGNVLVQMANADYGSSITESFCVSIDIPGCTDPAACNFDPSATSDDGSCQLPDGCTDPAACNFNPAATCDDGSCVLPNGCTDAGACNFDPAATCDDGSCEFTSCAGCTDVNACNYDPAASIDDGSCQLPDGCTDSTACNFDPAATCDDGTCTFAQTYFADNDGDGFGAGAAIPLCTPQAGFVTNSGDCDDTNSAVFPGAPGTAEGIDNNCNGSIDPSEELVGCLGDFNNDGLRNTEDFLQLLSAFGCLSGCDANDLNDDGLITSADILVFLSLFGSECP